MEIVFAAQYLFLLTFFADRGSNSLLYIQQLNANQNTKRYLCTKIKNCQQKHPFLKNPSSASSGQNTKLNMTE